ncbi:MAG: hypothetical protein ACXAC7_13995 [Candidatus Hodarchaeales archaeon]|jgi:hypothetical protein
MKFSFKELLFEEPTIAITTFFSGSIKSALWDFSKETIEIKGVLTKIKPSELVIKIDQPADRGAYDWRDPYQFVALNSPDSSIESKVRREARIPEKMSKILGKTEIIIKGSDITLNIDKNTKNLRSALDLIKELGWLIDITLN